MPYFKRYPFLIDTLEWYHVGLLWSLVMQFFLDSSALGHCFCSCTVKCKSLFMCSLRETATSCSQMSFFIVVWNRMRSLKERKSLLGFLSASFQLIDLQLYVSMRNCDRWVWWDCAQQTVVPLPPSPSSLLLPPSSSLSVFVSRRIPPACQKCLIRSCLLRISALN